MAKNPVNQVFDDLGPDDDTVASYPVSSTRMAQLNQNSINAGAGGVPGAGTAQPAPAPAQAPAVSPLQAMASPFAKDPVANAIYQQMLARESAQRSAQQPLIDAYQQQIDRLGQGGISDLDKASMFFQAAGALAAPTRSGSLMESIGSAGTAVSGPLQKAAQAERDRQDKIAQLQLARTKLSSDMAGNVGVSPSDLLALAKFQRDGDKDTEKFSVQTYKDPRTGVETPYYAGTQGTIKPIDLNSIGITPGQPPAGTGLTGDEFLTDLQKNDPGLAAKVKAVADGRLSMPPINSRAPDAQRLLQAVSQYDPDGLNDIMTGARRKLFTSFTAGPDADQVKALNTVMMHLGKLQETAASLNNSRIPMWNDISNAISTNLGQDAVTNFNFTKKAVADELSRVLKGTATEGEVKRWNEAINSSQSPQQLQGAISTAMDLIDGRMQAIGNKYEEGMSYKYKTNNGLTLLSPEAQKAYQKIRSTSVESGPAPQQAPAAPAGKPDAQGWTTMPNGVRVRLKPSQEQ